MITTLPSAPCSRAEIIRQARPSAMRGRSLNVSAASSVLAYTPASVYAIVKSIGIKCRQRQYHPQHYAGNALKARSLVQASSASIGSMLDALKAGPRKTSGTGAKSPLYRNHPPLFLRRTKTAWKKILKAAVGDLRNGYWGAPCSVKPSPEVNLMGFTYCLKLSILRVKLSKSTRFWR